MSRSVWSWITVAVATGSALSVLGVAAVETSVPTSESESGVTFSAATTHLLAAVPADYDGPQPNPAHTPHP